MNSRSLQIIFLLQLGVIYSSSLEKGAESKLNRRRYVINPKSNFQEGGGLLTVKIAQKENDGLARSRSSDQIPDKKPPSITPIMPNETKYSKKKGESLDMKWRSPLIIPYHQDTGEDGNFSVSMVSTPGRDISEVIGNLPPYILYYLPNSLNQEMYSQNTEECIKEVMDKLWVIRDPKSLTDFSEAFKIGFMRVANLVNEIAEYQQTTGKGPHISKENYENVLSASKSFYYLWPYCEFVKFKNILRFKHGVKLISSAYSNFDLINLTDDAYAVITRDYNREEQSDVEKFNKDFIEASKAALQVFIESLGNLQKKYPKTSKDVRNYVKFWHNFAKIQQEQAIKHIKIFANKVAQSFIQERRVQETKPTKLIKSPTLREDNLSLLPIIPLKVDTANTIARGVHRETSIAELDNKTDLMPRERNDSSPLTHINKKPSEKTLKHSISPRGEPRRSQNISKTSRGITKPTRSTKDPRKKPSTSTKKLTKLTKIYPQDIIGAKKHLEIEIDKSCLCKEEVFGTLRETLKDAFKIKDEP